MRGSHQLHTPHSASEPFTQAALCADLCAAAEDPRSDIGIVLRCRKPRVFNRQKMIVSCKTDHQISGFSDVFRQTPVFLHYITTLESITQLLLVKHWIFALRWSWCPPANEKTAW